MPLCGRDQARPQVVELAGELAFDGGFYLTVGARDASLDINKSKVFVSFWKKGRDQDRSQNPQSTPKEPHPEHDQSRTIASR